MNEEVRRAIGRRLKESRKSANLSQEAVAQDLSVLRQTVSAWECGSSSPSSAAWFKLGQMYGVSLDYLVYGVRTMPVSEYAVLGSVFAPSKAAVVAD